MNDGLLLLGGGAALVFAVMAGVWVIAARLENAGIVDVAWSLKPWGVFTVYCRSSCSSSCSASRASP